MTPPSPPAARRTTVAHAAGKKARVTATVRPPGGDLAARLLESLRQPLLAVRPSGEIAIANLAASQLLRAPQAMLVGSSITSFLLPGRAIPFARRDPTELFAGIVRAAETHGGVLELDLVAPTARLPQVTATITALRPVDGCGGGWLFALDRRSRVHSHADRPSRDRYFELTPDLVALIGRDDHFVELNPAWASLGYGRDELFTTCYLDVLHPDDRARLAAEVDAVFDGGAVAPDVDARVLAADGTAPRRRWTAVADPLTDAVLLVGREVRGDVDQLERLQHAIRAGHERERELTAALERAEHQSRARADLVSWLSHELRTPLNSIIGFAGLLLDGPDGPDGEAIGPLAASYVERVHRNGMHLLTLVEEVLDLVKVEAAPEVALEPVDVESVVTEVLSLSAVAARERAIDLELLLPFDGATVDADRTQLFQVLLELVGNAVKYAPGGLLRVRVVAADAPRVGALDRIDVIDGGPGIAPGLLASVFDPFTRGAASSTAGQGTGLGLTLSRAMCRAMGFDLVVDSIEGRGTTFSILLDEGAERPVHAGHDPGPDPGQAAGQEDEPTGTSR